MARTAKVSQALAMLEDPRAARFVENYVENPNATQAAIAAGYSVKSAHELGSRLLKRVEIKEAIGRRNAELLMQYEVTPDRIIKEFSKIAFSNVENYVALQDDGTLSIDFTTASKAQLAALASLEEDVTEYGRRNKFKLHDKQKALVELARLARMYPAERTELTGANGGPITAVTLNATQHKIEIGELDHEQRAQLRETLLMLKQQRDKRAEET